LRSAIWRDDIRPRVWDRDGGLCRLCRRDAEHVHHLLYDDIELTGADITMIIAVCRNCHRECHFGRYGNFRLFNSGLEHAVVKLEQVDDFELAELIKQRHPVLRKKFPTSKPIQSRKWDTAVRRMATPK
jgi:hypothetical protein